jgi:hypothetical protein
LVLWDPLAGKVKRKLTKDTIWYTIREDPNDDNLLWMAGYLQQGFCRFNKTSYDYHCYKHRNADPHSPSSDSSIRFIFDARITILPGSPPGARPEQFDSAAVASCTIAMSWQSRLQFNHLRRRPGPQSIGFGFNCGWHRLL